MTGDDVTTCTPVPGPPVEVLAMMEAIAVAYEGAARQAYTEYERAVARVSLPGESITLDMTGGGR